MASENKKAKTDKRKHWGRDGKFLKDTGKFKRLNFFNASLRRKINNIDEEITEALKEERQIQDDLYFQDVMKG